MRIGAHVSAAGGLSNAPARAAALGGNCAQIFLSGPTNWRMPVHDETQIAGFREQVEKLDVTPVVAHAIYLINLASPDDRIWQQSIDSLVGYLELGDRLGLAGVVTHLGSHKKLGFAAVQDRLFEAVGLVLRRAAGSTPLLMEVCAGQGGNIGAHFEELGAILKALDGDPRLGICLDTAHMLASGYDVATQEGLDATVESLEREVGLDRIAVVHANDSQGALGSNLDRHANIGEGHIGIDGFARIVTHPALRSLPFMLEVPGTDHQGPDAENIKRLVELVGDLAGRNSLTTKL